MVLVGQSSDSVSVSVSVPVPPVLPFTYSFKPEYVWTYEAFARTELFDKRVQVNANIFYSRYRDMQLPFIVAAPFVTEIRNAERAITYGAELTARWLVARDQARIKQEDERHREQQVRAAEVERLRRAGERDVEVEERHAGRDQRDHGLRDSVSGPHAGGSGSVKKTAARGIAPPSSGSRDSYITFASR